jgi:hypothetical protein
LEREKGLELETQNAPARIPVHRERDFGHLRIVPGGSKAPSVTEVQSGCNSVAPADVGPADDVRDALEAALAQWNATADLGALEARLEITLRVARRRRGP